MCRCWSFGLGFQNRERKDWQSLFLIYSVCIVGKLQYISVFKVEYKSLDTVSDTGDKTSAANCKTDLRSGVTVDLS